jgi:hypothetical protein
VSIRHIYVANIAKKSNGNVVHSIHFYVDTGQSIWKEIEILKPQDSKPTSPRNAKLDGVN